MSSDPTRFPVALPLTELIDATGTAWTCRLCQLTAGAETEGSAQADALMHIETKHYGLSVTPVIPLDGPDTDRKLGPVARYLSRLED